MSFKQKVKYKIDVVKVLNRTDLKSAVKDKLRPLMQNSLFKSALAESVKDEIRRRTTNLKIDENSDSLGKYSKDYANSQFGKVYGKKAGSRVNLTASGEMLSSIEHTFKGNELVLYFSDEFNAAKAHGHINGYINQDPKLKRPFFGLPKEVEERLIKRILSKEYKTALRNTIAEVAQAEAEILKELGPSVEFRTNLTEED